MINHVHQRLLFNREHTRLPNVASCKIQTYYSDLASKNQEKTVGFFRKNKNFLLAIFKKCVIISCKIYFALQRYSIRRRVRSCTIKCQRNFWKSFPPPISARLPCADWTTPARYRSWSRCWRRTSMPARPTLPAKSPRRRRTSCPTARPLPQWASIPTSSCAPLRLC